MTNKAISPIDSKMKIHCYVAGKGLGKIQQGNPKPIEVYLCSRFQEETHLLTGGNRKAIEF